MSPVQTAQLPLTPVEDREAIKVIVLKPRGTLYWGGAGLDGAYLVPQLEAFKAAGISHCFVGLTNSGTAKHPGIAGTFIDAIRSGLSVRYRDDDEWTISSGMTAEAKQFNLIGYSYGSLLAAQTAWSYARNGHTIDHLVLVGSPIDGDFLKDLKGHRNIGKVTVIDLTEHGDPIYAGMSEAELLVGAPLLAKQFAAKKGEGHFYYAHVVKDSPERWSSLAKRIVAAGVK
ncbi:thioesterase domain-containing protein [Ralstonia solanacearum]|uniref:thioesterase domain-containing protein n=1 Tax=Ralstonia solanacearum TaxID=305 RepID=UPI001FF736BE|nr:thioesterase domain-containing protein [Ralstonia solanacearum]MDC6237015.1 thioesterase domain-containing protein [Ralstonia solanacearum]MDD7810582.1 thioesterase domain-containing protein [Ralstonia solanacearum]